MSRWAGLLLAAGLACGGSDERPAPGLAPPEPTPSAPAPERPPQPTPPPAATPVEAEGARLYALYCASCHGARGDGDGPVARSLEPRPARHSDGATMNALSDDYLFRVIDEGGAALGRSPLMAPWGGTLDDGQIRSVVAFIRSLADPPYRPDDGG